MKRIVSFIFLSLLLIVSIAEIAKGFGQAVNIQTRKIEGFEEKGGWEVKFSKFRCRNWNNEDKEKPDDAQSWITWIEANEAEGNILPDGLPPEVRGKEEKTVMGIKACFSNKGYNWIVVEPKKQILLNGITKAVDLWVWGAGYDYDLYIVLKNWQGLYYSLYMGNLKYYGWRNLRVEIPDYISQYTQYVPRLKPLEIIRLKLIANPNEKPDDFYVYFDYMQAQVDVYEERYNGDGLNKKRW
jgi:hypothetical protein